MDVYKKDENVQQQKSNLFGKQKTFIYIINQKPDHQQKLYETI